MRLCGRGDQGWELGVPEWCPVGERWEVVGGTGDYLPVVVPRLYHVLRMHSQWFFLFNEGWVRDGLGSVSMFKGAPEK